MKTLVVGAAIVDLMMKIDRLPKSGEDIPCKETKTVIGGCAFNVANTLRNLNSEHALCVPVGNGMYADLIRKGMSDKGYKPLIEEENEDNGYCLSLVEADGERTFITVQGAECHFKKEWFENLKEDFDAIYLAGYQACGESGQIISNWMKTLNSKEIFFAPGPMITSIETSTMDTILSLKPILHVNEMEALSYTETENVESAIKELYERTHNIVFVTLGSKGTAYYDGQEIEIIPSVKTTVVDTVGAGDSHIGAIIAGLSKGLSIKESVLLANRVASIVVGTSGPIIEKKEFEKMMEEK